MWTYVLSQVLQDRKDRRCVGTKSGACEEGDGVGRKLSREQYPEADVGKTDGLKEV